MTTEERKALLGLFESVDAELVLMTQNNRVVLNREILQELIGLLKVQEIADKLKNG
jgi:hypothetical protein